MNKLLSLLLALILLSIPTVAAASDITGAEYYATIQVTENGTAATNEIATVFTTNLTDYMNSTRTDASMKYSGNDVAFQPPPPGSDTWASFVQGIGKSQNLDYALYLQGATDGKFRYFPADAGMRTSDNTSLELTDNFTYEAKGYFDPTVSGNITSKYNAFYLIGDGSGTVMAGIGTDNVSPTGFIDGGGTWNNEANAYDGNIATAANENAHATGTWGNFLELTHAAIDINEISYYAGNTPLITQIDIEAYYGGIYHSVYTGVFIQDSMQTVKLDGLHSVTKVQFRFYNGGGAGVASGVINEVNIGVTNISVSASGVSSGEKIFKASMDSPFFGLGIEASPFALPVTANLTMNAPLWQTEEYAAPGGTFTTIDSNAYTGTVTAAVWTDEGYYFDGAGDYLSFPMATHLIVGTDDFTYIAWSKRSLVVIANMLSWGTAGGPVQFHITSGNLVVYGIDHQILSIATSFGAETGVLHQYVWQREGGVWRVFTDGIQRGGDIADAQDFDVPNTTYKIGVYANGASQFYTGYVLASRLYDDALTPAEILQNFNAGKSKTSIGGDIYIYSTLSGVPDNANDYISFTNGVMPYVEYQEITIGGVQKQYVDWEYGSTFTDSSGSGHWATPTFRTVTSDLNVTAAMTGLFPVTEAKTSAFTLGGITDILTTDPSSIPQMYTELDVTRIPAGAGINAILNEADVPQALWWFPFLFGIIIILGLLAYGATTMRIYQGMVTNNGDMGSLLLMCVIIEALLAVFGIMNPIPFWPAILFPIPALAIMLSTKHQSVG